MGNPFADLIPVKGNANPFADLIPQQGITPDNVVRSLASGASFGLADEIAAAGDATFGPLVDRFTKSGTSAAPDWKARYEENLSRERGQNKAYEEQNPIADIAGKVVGGVGGAVAMLPGALTSLGPSAIANVARATGTGAGLGALQGFGEGEGTQDRLERAGIGGAIGGTLGAAARPLAAAGRSISESAVGRAIGDTFRGAGKSAQEGALERLATALQRGKVGPEDIGGKLKQFGNEAMLADTDPQLLSAALGVKVLPGQTRSIAEANLVPRDRAAGTRLVGAFEGGEAAPSTFAAGRAMEGNLSGVGQKAYGGMREAGLTTSPEMEAIMQRAPAIRETIAQIEQDAAQFGTALSPVDVMHRVKQTLNRNADAAFTSGKPVNKADVGSLANEWEAAFWQANPTAKQADTLYAQAASLPETMQAGRNFLRKGTSESATDSSAPALADLLLAANPQQVLAARTGATNAARETALEGTRPARALAQRIDESGPVQEKLVQLYGPERAAQITRQAATEGVFANTSNKLRGGSQTAEKASDAIDMMGNVQLRGTPSGVFPRATESLKALANWVRNPNEAVRNKIGELTLSPDAKVNEETLRLLAELLQGRQGGRRFGVGLSGAAGGIAGGQ